MEERVWTGLFPLTVVGGQGCIFWIGPSVQTTGGAEGSWGFAAPLGVELDTYTQTAWGSFENYVTDR